jgi:hypothetical protein
MQGTQVELGLCLVVPKMIRFRNKGIFVVGF